MYDTVLAIAYNINTQASSSIAFFTKPPQLSRFKGSNKITSKRQPSHQNTRFTTNLSSKMSQQQGSSGSGTSRPSPPGSGSQTNWNEVLRYSSPIGVVKSDIVYGVYNTSSSSQGGQGSSSSSSQGSGSNRPR